MEDSSDDKTALLRRPRGESDPARSSDMQDSPESAGQRRRPSAPSTAASGSSASPAAEDDGKTRLPGGAEDKTRLLGGDDLTRLAGGGEDRTPLPGGGDDKTQLLGGDYVTGLAARPEDKTQFLDSGEDKTQLLDAVDKTQLLDAVDKTQLQRGAQPAAGEERTRLHVTDSTAGEPGEDATRLHDPGAPSAAEDTQPDDLTAGRSEVDLEAERGAGKTIVKDRFVLEKLLGAGGMGSVYKAKDLRKVEARDRNPWVAVKLLNEDFRTHPGAFMSLQREARKSQTFAHPNIVKVYDFDRDGDVVFMTLELLSGNDLNHYIKNNPDGVDMEDVLRLTQEMGSALMHAHSHNLTHADFKPANVFITEEGVSKVLDFGIAQAVANVDASAAEDDKTAFDPGSLGALTPAYASLEMLKGMDPIPADDVYALACIAYQLVSGKHPYGKMPADQALEKGKQAPRLDKLSRRQWRALQKGIALKREDRYETAAEFIKDFAPFDNPTARRLGIAVGVALVLAGIGIFQAVSDYYREEARVAEVQRQKAELDKEAQLLKAQQSLKDSLDGDFSQLRASVDAQQGALDAHRFSFEPRQGWHARMEALLNDLRQLHFGSEWQVILAKATEIEESIKSLLHTEEQERRDAARDATDNWIVRYREKVAEDYLSAASSMARNQEFSQAQAQIDTAARLAPDLPKLDAAREELQSLVEASQREAQALLYAAQQAKLAQDFEADDAAQRASLETCTQTLSRTGRGGQFTYDINGLARRTQAMERKYASLGGAAVSAIAGYVEDLGGCIQMFGYADPAGAREKLEVARQAFPAYSAALADLPIQPWNNCKASFAGKGSRYDCQDRFLGQEGRGPVLVVIPAGNGLAEFAIGKYEVSIEEFNTWCQQEGACTESELDGSLPVTGPSVEQVSAYLDWLSRSTGFRYQLPSHEQWTYAADAAGTGTDPGRNCTLSARGIVKGEVFLPIDSGTSNQWGLVHHLGNAREMVTDAGGVKAAGGSRADPMDSCTVQALADFNGSGDSYTGFRVVRLQQ